MVDAPRERPAHPCIARRCGHGAESHTHTPELESGGEIVLWCAACRRHEVRSPGWFGGSRRRRDVAPPYARFTGS